MELLNALKERKSYRAFTAQAVPKDIIEKVIRYAILAPSARNMQPWEYIVVTGGRKEALGTMLVNLHRGGSGNLLLRDENLPEEIKKRLDRQVEEREKYYKQVGISLPAFNPEGSFNFHGAPVAVFICVDDKMKSNALDIGITLAYFMLAAHDLGLGTCPIGFVNMYEPEIKQFLDIPEKRKIIISIALGYPDFNNPVTGYRSHRDELSGFLSWR